MLGNMLIELAKVFDLPVADTVTIEAEQVWHKDYKTTLRAWGDEGMYNVLQQAVYIDEETGKERSEQLFFIRYHVLDGEGEIDRAELSEPNDDFTQEEVEDIILAKIIDGNFRPTTYDISPRLSA